MNNLEQIIANSAEAEAKTKYEHFLDVLAEILLTVDMNEIDTEKKAS